MKIEDVKYIYFESYYTHGWELENCNVLLIKPHTNSEGYWGFRNRTQTYSPLNYCIVDQNWIDLTKFKFKKSNIISVNRFNENVKKVLDIIENTLNEL